MSTTGARRSPPRAGSSIRPGACAASGRRTARGSRRPRAGRAARGLPARGRRRGGGESRGRCEAWTDHDGWYVGAGNKAVTDNTVRYAACTVADRPYHHGNLRAALLRQAERMLRDQSLDQLSLRELARQVGVSHGAPRRHFADRQALLDALAEAGFARLGAELQEAVDGAGEDYEARLRAIAAAYVRFAIHDAALLELMFAGKRREQQSGALHEAADRAFSVILELIQQGRPAACSSAASPSASACCCSRPCRASPRWSPAASSTPTRSTGSSPTPSGSSSTGPARWPEARLCLESVESGPCRSARPGRRSATSARPIRTGLRCGVARSPTTSWGGCPSPPTSISYSPARSPPRSSASSSTCCWWRSRST